MTVYVSSGANPGLMTYGTAVHNVKGMELLKTDINWVRSVSTINAVMSKR